MSKLYKEVGYLARRQLAVVLDRDSPRGLDWKGLADKMSFSYEVIVSLRGSRSPTLALLERWENNAGCDASLTTLTSLLQSLGCVEGVDILNKEKERRVEHIDVPKASLSNRPAHISGSPHTPCSSLDPSALDPDEIQRLRQVQVATEIDPERLAEGLANLSVTAGTPREDVASLQSHKYDVFLSFAEEDERFAEEVRLRLVENVGVKVFVPSSGMASDRAFHEEISDMIKEGCIRTVIILSPDYISSPWCGFEANLAFIRSPDVRKNLTIPILYRACKVPAFLSHVHYLDYPRFSAKRKECEEYFWGRLYKSIRHST
ncbi:myeloid differentiation primary response protein MyD88-like [Halichondria panicea]|uniref:myeloid differentiation primary response protein MyD88-like n=1 Tax=Halichondria panicea TaxID=6063 RepID=UPI00312B2C12